MSYQIYQKFMNAVQNTKVLRERKNFLFTFGNTRLPYILLANSIINEGNCIIRTGEVVVEKPQIIVADDKSLLEGFDIDENIDINQVKLALLSRGIHFPPMSYKNSTQHMEVVNDRLDVVIERQMNQLEDANDSRTGLIQCKEDTWNLSLLHYVLMQVARSSSSNLHEYLERYPLG